MKATLAFGRPASKDAATASVTSTVVGYVRNENLEAPTRISLDVELDATLAADATGATLDASPRATQARTTVLPRRVKVEGAAPVSNTDERPRFARVKQLGEGAVGTVELARDNDIRRTVAVKKLRSDVKSPGTLLRFADEVRIVGQLEHPNIVPIYDVGRDADGDVYLVMKHLDGETMEEVIEKLRAGDRAYVERFTPHFRAQLFLGVLDAMRYAHSRGVLHRDLKPANIMIGRYDEVTVMDWGIAKPIGAVTSDPSAPDPAQSWRESHDGRLLETQIGTLAGTPLYMSPEQAAGMNDTLDERSDVFALAVVFYEWLTLSHPLEAKTTLMQVLASVITQEPDHAALLARAVDVGVPCEFIYVIRRAHRRDRQERLQSVGEMYELLKDALEGKMAVQCPVTFAKRAANTTFRWVDMHPRLFSAGLVASGLLLVVGLGAIVLTIVRAVS